MINNGLRGPPLLRAGGRAVQPVLEYIKVHRAHIRDAEIGNAVIDGVKFIFGICPGHAADKLVKAVKRPAVNLLQRFVRNDILFGVKVIEIAKHKPAGISDLPVSLRQPFQNIGRYPHIFLIIFRGDPQPQHFGAVLLDDLIRAYDIAF